MHNLWRSALGLMLKTSPWSPVFVLVLLSPAVFSAPAANSAAAMDHLDPQFIAGHIFALRPDPQKLLFKSARMAAQAGSKVHVVCEYTEPDGKLAARERAVYDHGKLSSFSLEGLQSHNHGKAVVRSDTGNPAKYHVEFEYTIGDGRDAKTTRNTETLDEEPLVNDMLAGFIAAHWDALLQGSAVRLRYIVLPRKETVGFQLAKDSETTFQQKPAVRIKMEPTSFVIARLVEPLFFTVEKAAPHAILAYTGRTTPLLKSGSKWKPLDAQTIFERKPLPAQPLAFGH